MKALLLTLTLLNCGDSLTTHQGLSMGAQEANPFIKNAVALDVLRATETAVLLECGPESA